mgnify:FL=1
MAKESTWQIPIDRLTGRIVNWSGPTTGQTDGDKIIWKPGTWQFDAVIAYCGIWSSRGGCGGNVRDVTTGQPYTVTRKTFDEIMPRMVHGVIAGHWGFTKHGEQLNLVYIGEKQQDG